MRREFALPEFDQVYLNGLGLDWETLAAGGEFWVIIHAFPVTPGYGRTTVAVAIKIEPGYPNAQLDMAYFHPSLARADGLPIGATQHMQPIDGKAWQRWSRHRTQQNPWIPGEDSLETHMALVTDWLCREFERRAA